MGEKPVGIVNVEDMRAQVSDVVIVGNPDALKLLFKASSKLQNWMKSAKALEIPGEGCVVQLTTQVGDAVAETSSWVPGVHVEDDVNGGRKLVGGYPPE